MYASNHQKISLAILILLICFGIGYFYYSSSEDAKSKSITDLKIENPFKDITKKIEEEPKKEIVYQNSLYSFTYTDDLKISDWKDGDIASLNLKSADYEENENGEVKKGFKIEIINIAKNIYNMDHLVFLDKDKKDFGEEVYREPNYNYQDKIFYKKVLKGKGIDNKYENNNSFMIVGLYNEESQVVAQIIMTTKSEDDLLYETVHHDLIKSFEWAKVGKIL